MKTLCHLAGLNLQRSPERWWKFPTEGRCPSTVPMAALQPPRPVVGSAFTAAKRYRAMDAV